MGPINGLPEFQLEASVRQLERNLEELKTTAQRFAGSNVLGILGQSSSPYDWSGILATDPTQGAPYGRRYLQVEATASRMDNLFGDLIIKLMVGSPSNWYRPSQMLVDQMVPPNYLSWQSGFYDDTIDVTDRRKKRWQVYLLGDNSTTAYLKFYVVGSDDVTMSVSVIA